MTINHINCYNFDELYTREAVMSCILFRHIVSQSRSTRKSRWVLQISGGRGRTASSGGTYVLRQTVSSEEGSSAGFAKTRSRDPYDRRRLIRSFSIGCIDGILVANAPTTYAFPIPFRSFRERRREKTTTALRDRWRSQSWMAEGPQRVRILPPTFGNEVTPEPATTNGDAHE